jgi:hypothetical protein
MLTTWLFLWFEKHTGDKKEKKQSSAYTGIVHKKPANGVKKLSDYMDNVNIVENYLVLLLGVQDSPIPSVFHVEKELFILSNVNPKTKETFLFEKHYQGPYSQIVKEVLEEPVYYKNAFEFGDTGIRLTSQGKKVYSKILLENKNNERFNIILSTLKLVRQIYDKLSKNELALLVYLTYPKYFELSNISDKLLKNKYVRKKIIRRLVLNGLIDNKRYIELIGD